jgi:hypothetical protein
MARDLTVAWELLTAVTRARQHLATARPLIWEKAHLPTAEHTIIVKAPADGIRRQESSVNATDQVVMRVSLETHLVDGRRLMSCLDIVASPHRWKAQPYITLADGVERRIWEGQSADKDDPSSFAESVDSAARSLLDATMSLDFSDIDKGH